MSTGGFLAEVAAPPSGACLHRTVKVLNTRGVVDAQAMRAHGSDIAGPDPTKVTFSPALAICAPH